MNIRKSVRQNHLSFPILSDAKGEDAAAFGLRFELPDYLIEVYKRLKNDLPAFNVWPGKPGRCVSGSVPSSMTAGGVRCMTPI